MRTNRRQRVVPCRFRATQRDRWSRRCVYETWKEACSLLLRLVAFRGELATEDPSAVEKKEPEPQRTFLAAVSRGAKGLKKGDDMPGSLAALQADLLGREKELDGRRGIIDKGAKKEASAIQRVFFKPLPTVGVADITIRYYTAKK